MGARERETEPVAILGTHRTSANKPQKHNTETEKYEQQKYHQKREVNPGAREWYSISASYNKLTVLLMYK